MDGYTEILFQVEQYVATITLNRPEAYNALSDVMRDDLRRAIEYINHHPEEIRIVVVTGAGKAFCAGGDIKLMKKRIEDGTTYQQRLDTYKKDVADMVLRFRSIRQPMIAALNGATYGAGCSIAMLCDIRVASEKAKFGLPFGRRGLIPDWGATYFLPRVVGTAKAIELASTGASFDAETARQIGLVDRITPADTLIEQVRQLCDEMLLSSPGSLVMSKQAIYDSMAMELEKALEAEGIAQSLCFTSQDHREGVDCFLEKRPPVFTGR